MRISEAYVPAAKDVLRFRHVARESSCRRNERKTWKHNLAFASEIIETHTPQTMYVRCGPTLKCPQFELYFTCRAWSIGIR
jgi:hypothetical protein